MRKIRVGFTEAHGMAAEASQHPPEGVEYSFVNPSRRTYTVVRSPIKGYYRRFDSPAHDILEAVLTPIATSNRWIYSCENLPAMAAFSLLGMPLPRAARIVWLRRLLLKKNCRQVVFWSKAGRATMQSYGNLADDAFEGKDTVVYPAVRQAPDALVRFTSDEAVTFLFSGDFFRKGGLNVLDAFEECQRQFPGISLLVCSALADFRTPNAPLREECLRRIDRNPGIQLMGRVGREELLSEILPRVDVYLLPTYAETFGMAILESMTFGIPVVATNHFAIPEMVADGQTGLLIDTSHWNTEEMFRGYTVNEVPSKFREYVSGELRRRMVMLIESPELRKKLGLAALTVARTEFSFTLRNERMAEIYQRALG